MTEIVHARIGALAPDDDEVWQDPDARITSRPEAWVSLLEDVPATGDGAPGGLHARRRGPS